MLTRKSRKTNPKFISNYLYGIYLKINYFKTIPEIFLALNSRKCCKIDMFYKNVTPEQTTSELYDNIKYI